MSSPARDALEALVGQFSERSAFVRELIQNSLDAGAGRVELHVVQEKRRLVIDVVDDGEGMDRDVIEDYLLTLFRSSKEKDLTKIGKFGIGFVSLFALNPELVVVDTARDGVHHRVVFEADRSYTLAEVDEPFEGTRVRLYVRTWGKKAEALAGELRQAIHYWCKHAHAEIHTTGDGKGWGWDEDVGGGWDVDSPLKLSVEEPGFRVVLGAWPERVAPVAYTNRGLTLLEGKEDAVPGVTFRVEAARLEHTLTRDNVMRDRGFAAVVARIRELAEGPLTELLVKELRAATAADDIDRVELLARTGTHLKVPDELPWMPLASGGFGSVEDFEPGLFDWGEQPLWYADGPSQLVDAVSDESPVLLGPLTRIAFTTLRWRWIRLSPRSVEEHWIRPRSVPAPDLAAAMVQRAAEHSLFRRDLAFADFREGGKALDERLAIVQKEPGALQRSPDRSGVVVVNVAHPQFVRAALLPEDIGATVLMVAVLRALSDASPLTEAVVLDLVE